MFVALFKAWEESLIERTMKMIENRTKIGNRACITFKKQIDENNYLEIHNGVGCNSHTCKFKQEIYDSYVWMKQL